MSDRPTPWYRRLLALAELAGDRNQQDIAQAMGISKSTVTGWKEGTAPRPDQVKMAARVYGADPLELMRLAYLSDGDEPKEAPKKKRPPLRADPNGPPL